MIDERTRPTYAGPQLLGHPLYSKGSVFNREVRQAFGLEGLLPSAVNPVERRARRVYEKFATGSEYDVQFTDLKKEYAFGVAVFDNAQVRHAYTPGVLRLKFE